jgi:hypothetical protein
VIVIDLVEDHRLPLGRNPTGEAAADGDPNTLLDLFFDPDCRARDELVGPIVAEEDRARICAEDVANARKQDVEEIVQLEVRDGDVGDGLNLLDADSGVALGLERACVLDRERRPVGRELQQLDVLVTELPGAERPDVENSKDLPGDEQRDAQHRLDALVPKDLIENVGVVDVREYDGRAARGDSTGETPPDRDPHPLLDFFLDSDRRSGDQLVRLGVEEEHRAGLDVEALLRPQENRSEQLVEIEVGERRVGQREQTTKPL